MEIDLVRLHFSPQSLQLLNIAVAIIMFGVALDMHPRDFKTVFDASRAPLIGLCCQFLLLPAMACALTFLLQPQPSIALGIMLVAACPGGNFSNFLTHFSGGNTALSIAMSSVSTASSIVMTPLNIAFWGSLNPYTAPLLKSIAISPWEILETVALILLLPLALGMLINLRLTWLADKLHKTFQIFSLLFLVAFIAMALKSNLNYFVQYIGIAFWIVLLTNGLALGMGYGAARALKLQTTDARAVAFETGIQNSGFGLILIFNFFNGLGGMALIAAWWGIWHLISGLALAIYWRRKPAQSAPEAIQ
ncbi:MAG: bile acid:sodium symporter family protein [Candidatus Sericytochromatia bacterium]|nr:bile acid:sodium symporter family protein [Candidatus Sericytochromatia bacterium]